MTGEEIRKKGDEEIAVMIKDLRTKLFELRTMTVTEKVEDTTQFGKIRREIARLLGEQRSRELAKGAAPSMRRGKRAALRAKAAEAN